MITGDDGRAMCETASELVSNVHPQWFGELHPNMMEQGGRQVTL